jgi:hypothetical protein
MIKKHLIEKAPAVNFTVSEATVEKQMGETRKSQWFKPS